MKTIKIIDFKREEKEEVVAVSNDDKIQEKCVLKLMMKLNFITKFDENTAEVVYLEGFKEFNVDRYEITLEDGSVFHIEFENIEVI